MRQYQTYTLLNLFYSKYRLGGFPEGGRSRGSARSPGGAGRGSRTRREGDEAGDDVAGDCQRDGGG
jgi:hypothetical protein